MDRHSEATIRAEHERMEWQDLQAEVARLRRLNERTYCAYCEFEVPLSELDAPEKVAEHILECENHPLGIRVRELSAEVVAGQAER